MKCEREAFVETKVIATVGDIELSLTTEEALKLIYLLGVVEGDPPTVRPFYNDLWGQLWREVKKDTKYSGCLDYPCTKYDKKIRSYCLLEDKVV